MEPSSYFNSLDVGVKTCYDIAKTARARGLTL